MGQPILITLIWGFENYFDKFDNGRPLRAPKSIFLREYTIEFNSELIQIKKV